MRIASYNIHRAVGVDRRRDTARIAAVIGELQADVIGLQEVDWHHDHNDANTQFEYLAHLPGYQAIPGANLRDHRGHYGNLLLTRVPVREVRRIDISESKRERRGAIDVDLDTPCGGLRTIVTHFGLGIRERWRQAIRLRDIIADRSDHPTVILGDFNDWIPGSRTLRPLLATCMTSAYPASFPSFWPLLALDRILACAISPTFSMRVHDSPLARKASDHLPIVADIGIGDNAREEETVYPSRFVSAGAILEKDRPAREAADR